MDFGNKIFSVKKIVLIFKAGISMQTRQGDFDFWWKNPEKFGWKSSQFRFYKGKQLFLFDFESTSFRNILEIWNSRIRVKAKSQQDFAIEPNFQKKFDVSENLCIPIKLGELWNPSRLKWVLFRENSDKREILSTKNCEEIVWKIFEKNPIFWIKLCLSNGNAVPKHPNNMSF